jgi:hypothetical protein
LPPLILGKLKKHSRLRRGSKWGAVVTPTADMTLAIGAEPKDKVMVCLNQTGENLKRDLART